MQHETKVPRHEGLLPRLLLQLPPAESWIEPATPTPAENSCQEETTKDNRQYNFCPQQNLFG